MRILWLKTELLHPVDKGGKIRTYHMLRHLKDKHHITYLTLDEGDRADDALSKAGEYSNETVIVRHSTAAKFSWRFYLELAANAASGLPYALQKYASLRMREAIAQLIRQREFDVVVSDFLTPSINLPHDLPATTLLFQHNVEAMIWRRHYEVETNPAKKAFLKLQWKRMAAYEEKACKRFDHVVAVSSEDADFMHREYSLESVADVPTGVDTEYFAPRIGDEKNPTQIVFTGSMDWLPNEDAMRWFTDDILPIVRQQIPDISLVVVGRNPSASLVEMGQRDPAVVVTGRVPDVRPYMEKASAFIVPIRVGGGTRLKIFEAMAMGLPVISTTVGAEGLPLKDGVDILLRDDPAEFAAGVVELLKNKQLAGGVANRALAKVRENFGWEAVADNFADQCQAAIDGKKSLPLRVGLGSSLAEESG